MKKNEACFGSPKISGVSRNFEEMDLPTAISALIDKFPLYKQQELKLLNLINESIVNDYMMSYNNKGNDRFDYKLWERIFKTINDYEIEKAR